MWRSLVGLVFVLVALVAATMGISAMVHENSVNAVYFGGGKIIVGTTGNVGAAVQVYAPTDIEFVYDPAGFTYLKPTMVEININGKVVDRPSKVDNKQTFKIHLEKGEYGYINITVVGKEWGLEEPKIGVKSNGKLVELDPMYVNVVYPLSVP